MYLSEKGQDLVSDSGGQQADYPSTYKFCAKHISMFTNEVVNRSNWTNNSSSE